MARSAAFLRYSEFLVHYSIFLFGCGLPRWDTPGTPQNLTATGAKRKIVLSWTAGTPAPISGYNIYYDQAGKLQFITNVNAATTTYTDSGLTVGTEYCYVGILCT